MMGSALHPFLVTSYTNVLKDFFETKLLTSQNILATEERYEKIPDMIPDESIASELGERGKRVASPLVQKKKLMLFNGNSANICCNLENLRHKGCIGVLKRLCSCFLTPG